MMGHMVPGSAPAVSGNSDQAIRELETAAQAAPIRAADTGAKPVLSAVIIVDSGRRPLRPRRHAEQHADYVVVERKPDN